MADLTETNALNCSLSRRLCQPFGWSLPAYASLGLALFWSVGLGLEI